MRLQWGRDVSIPEIRALEKPKRAYRSFNGAGMFLSRKFDIDARPGDRAGGFNGAGMFLSRKSLIMRVNPRNPCASMGPGCFYPGN